MAADQKKASTDMVEVTVARGTVQTPEGYVGPGGKVRVTLADAKRLEQTGHVRAADYVEPAETQTGNLKVTSEDGPSVTTQQS